MPGRSRPDQADRQRPARADSQPADAKVIWRYDLINELRVSPHDSASCSVLIHGDVLYVGTSNGVDKSHERDCLARSPGAGRPGQANRPPRWPPRMRISAPDSFTANGRRLP